MTNLDLALITTVAIVSHICVFYWSIRLKNSDNLKKIYSEKEKKGQRQSEMVASWITPLHAFLLFAFLATGVLKVTDSQPINSLGAFLLTFFTAEIWHYFSHRMMHHRTLLFIHKKHHDSKVMTYFSGVSFSLLEKVAFTGGILTFLSLCSLIIPLSFAGIAGYFVVYLVLNVRGHLNFEFNSPHHLQTFIGKYFTGNTYHALHHGRYIKNYGLMTRFLDRTLGTEWEDYEEVYKSVQAGHPIQFRTRPSRKPVLIES